MVRWKEKEGLEGRKRGGKGEESGGGSEKWRREG